jgi:hypothetical protein
MRATPLPGLRNVDRYAEWAEWCEDVASRNGAGPWWYVRLLESVGDVVRSAISAALDSH